MKKRSSQKGSPPSPDGGHSRSNRTGITYVKGSHVMCGRSVMGTETLEMFLRGVGMVPRSERDAWSMAKRQRQARNEYAPPPSPPALHRKRRYDNDTYNDTRPNIACCKLLCLQGAPPLKNVAVSRGLERSERSQKYEHLGTHCNALTTNPHRNLFM